MVQTAGLDKDIHGHYSVNRIFTQNPLFVNEGVGALPGPEFELARFLGLVDVTAVMFAWFEDLF